MNHICNHQELQVRHIRYPENLGKTHKISNFDKSIITIVVTNGKSDSTVNVSPTFLFPPILMTVESHLVPSPWFDLIFSNIKKWYVNVNFFYGPCDFS